MSEARSFDELLSDVLRRRPDEQEAYLRSRTDDPDLQARVLEQIRSQETSDVMETAALPAPGDHPLDASGHAEVPGAELDRYTLIEPIGEGGFGTVWKAEQREPVQRFVALKIIKLGMDTKQVIARFEAERQALALMDHPNIAKVLDAGTTATGRPFFVMELVDGEAITDHCDRTGATTEERLQLFIDTCNAVQHAHQKGVIHRDIKPSNVLVTVQDGRPIPKVIDFGIAKATSARLTEQTIFTQLGQFIGTPEYMSPEQAAMSEVDIDTRSDIYSLGVLLYELLTGTTPFESTRLRRAGLAEIQRIIREDEPPKPSTRISALLARDGSDAPSSLDTPTLDGTDDAGLQPFPVTSSLADITRRRQTNPRTLTRSLRGDLDWIVMKAMEKDRARRYETANGLAADLRRYLAGEAVVAAPPSASYRMRKFVRRNEGLVTAVGVVAATLIVGIVGTTWGLLWALSEKERADFEAVRAMEATEAEIAANRKTAAARDRAESRFDLALVAIEDYQEAIDEHVEVKYQPELEGLRTSLLAAPRDFYAALRDDLAENADITWEQRLRLAHAHKSIATIDRQVGEQERAVESLRAGLAITEKLEREKPDDTEVQLLIAQMHMETGAILTAGIDRRPHLDEARVRFEALCDEQPLDTTPRRLLATTTYNLGQLHGNQGRGDEALRAFEDSLEDFRAVAAASEEDPLPRVYMAQVAYSGAQLLVNNRGEPERALEWIDRFLPETTSLAEEHPDEIEAQRALGLLLRIRGSAYIAMERHEDAISALRAAEAVWADLVDRYPAYTRLRYDQAHTIGQLGQLHNRAGDPQTGLTSILAQRSLLEGIVEAQPTNLNYRAALERCMLVEGAQYYKMGDKAKSLACFEALAPISEATIALDPEAVDRWDGLAGLYYNMGTIRSDIGSADASLADYKRSLEIRRRLVERVPDDPKLRNYLAYTLGNIGYLYLTRLEDPAEAAVWTAQARDVQREIVAKHDQVPGYLNALGRTLNTLGTIYWQLDNVDDAAEVYREARATQEKLVALNHMVSQYRRDLAMACWNHGLALRQMGEQPASDDAVAKALETWGALVKDFPDEQHNHVLLCSYSAQHVQHLAGTGQIDAAIALSGECVEQADALMAAAPDDRSIQQAAWRSHRGRAHTLARAGDIVGARVSYERAMTVLEDELTAQDAAVQEIVLAGWAGDTATVEQEAARLSTLPEITPRQMFYLAKSYALVAQATDDAAQSARLTDTAMSWLALAREHGYLDAAEAANDVRNGTSFALVRAHRDYDALLTDRTRSASVESDE